MRGRKHWPFKTGLLVAGLTLWFGTAVFAAPAIEGDTDLTVEADQVVTAQFTVTNEEPMESVSLMLSYDKDVMTYMSGSGGDNFDVTGGNGSVQMTSSPESTEAVFTVRFRGAEDTETTLEVVSCTAAVNGAEVDVLTGETVASEEEAEESDETAEGDEENEERASFVIDDRTFYVRRPGDMEGFDVVHMDIQGTDSRVLACEGSIYRAAGADVKSCAGGTVVFSGELPLLGQTDDGDHGLGVVSYYGCLSSGTKGVGDTVSAGEILAAADDTLYFAVSVGGVFVSPDFLLEHGIG